MANIISSSSAEAREKYEEEQPRIFQVTEGLKSRHTKEAYSLAFNQFIKVTVKSDNLRALLDTKQNVIESKIIDHIIHLRDVQKLSYWTIQVYCSGILHFFKMNDISLNIDKIKRFLPEDESDRYALDRPYSVTEIESMLAKCDIRSRVVILLMASTGMRVGAIPGLRLGDIKKMDEYGLYMIWVYNRSKADRYFTFCTPECVNSIDAYLKYRESFGEQLKDKSPLIREQFNIDNPFTANAPKSISQRMLCFVVEDVLKRAGVNQIAVGSKRRQVMRTHGFRKYFLNQCDRGNMNYSVRECLVGHKLPNQDSHYIRKTEEEMLAEYIKAIPLLTIDPNQRLEQENHDLKAVQAEELKSVKRQMKLMKDWMKSSFNQIVEWTRPLDPKLAESISLNSLQLDDPED